MENFVDSKSKSESGAIDVPIRIHFGVNAAFEGTDIDGNDLRSKSAKFLGTATKISSTGYVWHHMNLLKLGAVYSVLDEMGEQPFDLGQNPDWITMALIREGNLGQDTADIGLALYSLTEDEMVSRIAEEASLSESNLPVVLFGLRTKLENDVPWIHFEKGKSVYLPAPALASGTQTLWADPTISLDETLKGTGLKEKKDEQSIGIFTMGGSAEGLALFYIDGINGFDATQSVFADEFGRGDSVLHEENDEGRILLARKL